MLKHKFKKELFRFGSSVRLKIVIHFKKAKKSFIHEILVQITDKGLKQVNCGSIN